MNDAATAQTKRPRAERPTIQIPVVTRAEQVRLHFEVTPGHTACGHRIGEHLNVTDDDEAMERRMAEHRCRACWRVVERERGH